ncbi:hypothetical protein O3P69_016000 [Scylla paramamosain]|uniref:G-protein coupled receptors family 1 profile domain-containing protein n=1 Tax=Scylla paramamosain TaxID=85552 RepID=A0AAW0T9C7_SCYPA
MPLKDEQQMKEETAIEEKDEMNSGPSILKYEPNLRTLPDKYLDQIIHVLESFPNETVDIGKPHLRKSLETVYPLFLVLYGVVMVAGAVGNVAMALQILRRRLYRESTSAYLLNVALCNVLMVTVLLPFSLAILLIQNWVFGSFLCYFIPMLQDVPLHVTMGTLLAVAGDSYRRVVSPHKPPLPPFPAVLATWVLGVCIVLPYALYMHYIDLQVLLGPQFAGVGICTVNLEDDVTEYIHCLFIILFVLPLGVVAFLQVRVGVVLASMDDPTPPSPPRHLDLGPPDPHPRVWNLHAADHVFSSSLLTGGEGRALCSDHHQIPPFLPRGAAEGRGAASPSQQPPLHGGGALVEVARERRNHRYLVTLVSAFAVCVTPLMVLRLVKNMVMETTQNSAHFDLTFISLVWVAFLPTLTTPVLYAAWKMDRPLTDRVLGYLRLCPWERHYSTPAAHEMPPIFNSTHPHTAHRLSLEPSMLPAASRPLHPHHAQFFPQDLHRQHQYQLDRTHFPT